MDKSLLDRLNRLEDHAAELGEASTMSDTELKAIISADLGYIPTIEEIIHLALDDNTEGPTA